VKSDIESRLGGSAGLIVSFRFTAASDWFAGNSLRSGLILQRRFGRTVFSGPGNRAYHFLNYV
jgi:hypothetical protein